MARRLQPRQAMAGCAINSVTIKITQVTYGVADWLAACRAVTVTWRVCRYLIDLSGKLRVIYME